MTCLQVVIWQGIHNLFRFSYCPLGLGFCMLPYPFRLGWADHQVNQKWLFDWGVKKDREGFFGCQTLRDAPFQPNRSALGFAPGEGIKEKSMPQGAGMTSPPARVMR